jgi:two-component system NtrC family sensor kinase
VRLHTTIITARVVLAPSVGERICGKYSTFARIQPTLYRGDDVMSSIRIRITLLFLLVTIPLVLEILYQNRLATSMAAVGRTAHATDLLLAKELAEVVRLSQEFSRAELSGSKGLVPSVVGEIESAGARLSQLKLIEHETAPLRQAIVKFVQEASSTSEVNLPRMQRLNGIVAAEIKNLFIRLENKSQRRDKELATQLNDLRSTALWSATLLLFLGALITWVFASRYTAALHTLSRDIQRLTRSHLSNAPRVDEVDEVTHAFSDLCDTISHSMVDRQYLEDLLNSMSESVVVSDLMGKVVYSNAAAKKLFDRDSRGMVGQEVAPFVQFLWNVTDEGGDAWYDGPLHSDTDTSLHVFARRTHLLSDAEALEGTVYVIQDVSESRELTRANRAYRDRLSRSERLASFGTLGAIVAHKFSQPLSSVRLFLQQIQRELATVNVSETVRSNLTESLAELGRIADITKQMVTAGREGITQGNGQSAEARIAVERVFESLSEVAERRNVSLHNLCRNSADKVACTSFELEEILYCLINNSIQAAPDDRPTQVTVSTESQAGQTTIIVCDTGRGIAPDHLDKIFEWCFTTKPEGEGSGLGLAIVRSIIERHGGRITVTSEERIGSRFSIVLPRVEEVQNDSHTECLYC